MYSFGGTFSLTWLLLGSLPTFQISVYHFFCFSSDEYYSEETCSGGGFIVRAILSVVLFSITGMLCWLMGSLLRTSIPFEGLYLNSPNRFSSIEYVYWPMISTLFHMSGNSTARMVNLYIMACFSLLSIGLDLWEMSTFDHSVQLFYLIVKTLFCWLFLSPAIFHVY